MERFFDGLALGAIKESGPSPGVGHSFTNSVNSLGGRKNSGPSPGVGHRVVTGSGQ
ncbi:PAMP-induced secreted peptide 2 [Linum grandiflorum]